MASRDHAAAAVHCLNHLITDALEHVADVFEFMGRLRNPTVFNFCAIPQVSILSCPTADIN